MGEINAQLNSNKDPIELFTIEQREQASQQQQRRLQKDQYEIRKKEAGLYHEHAKRTGNERENYMQNSVRGAILKNLGRKRYTAFDSLKIKKPGQAQTEKVKLNHAAGSKMALNGEDVIEFNIAGSGFRYPRMDYKGVMGWFDEDEYREKELKVHWYNKTRLLNWLPGIKTKAHIDMLNAQRLKKNKQIEEIYGKKVEMKVLGKTLNHLRKKESMNAQGARKTRYSIAGPNAINIGKYSEDHLEEYILELGKTSLMERFNEWSALRVKDLAEKKPINIIIQGHSRGAVATGLGAMRLKRWIADNYPDYLNKVHFEVIQYDPVPGGVENFGNNEMIDHNPLDKKLEKKDSRYMSLGPEANTTVMYSIHTQHSGLFNPQLVKSPKRIILSMADHGVDLFKIDKTQKGPATRATYLAEKNGKVEAFRSSGLGQLDQGVYIADDQGQLIRLRSLDEYDALVKQLLKGSHLQQSRHRIVRKAVEDWFKRNGVQQVQEEKKADKLAEEAAAPELKQEDQGVRKEKKAETAKEKWDSRVTGLFQELVSRIRKPYYDETQDKEVGDEIWRRVSLTTEKDSETFVRFRDAVENVAELSERLRNDPEAAPTLARSMMRAMARLSETANEYYDAHRGHRSTTLGKERREACDMVRGIVREFYDRLDISMGGEGFANITRKKAGRVSEAARKSSAEKMGQLAWTWGEWKKGYAREKGKDLAKIRGKARFFERNMKDIERYKATHSYKEWPKEVEELIREADFYQLQYRLHRNYYDMGKTV